MRIIKLHFYIIKILLSRFKIKATKKEHITFLKNLTKSYLKELLNTYRYYLNFFDLEYIKQRANYKKNNQYRKDIQNAYRLILWMIKQGENRKERRHIRRDFEKFGRLSKETQTMILKDLYGYKE